MEKAWSLALWCVLVCYNTGYRVGKLKGLPSRRKGIMNMARYHYTRENGNGVVLYLESEPAEDAMDEDALDAVCDRIAPRYGVELAGSRYAA